MNESEAVARLREMLPEGLRVNLGKELKGIVDIVFQAVREAVPEYAGATDGPYAQLIRSAIEQGINSLIVQISQDVPPVPEQDDLFYRIGEYEAREGRQLDTLVSAYRAAGISAWQTVVDAVVDHNLDPELLVALSEVVYGRIQEITAFSEAGYLRAQRLAAIRPAESRLQLLRVLVGGRAGPGRIEVLAVQAGWTVPATLTPVALRPGHPVVLSLLAEDILVDLAGDQPCLLVPGVLEAGRLDAVTAALAGNEAAVGPIVPPDRVHDSLRWARQALRLTDRGVLDTDGVLIHCDQNLIPLLLHVDEPLVRYILRRGLQDLLTLTPTKRRQSIETLLSYLRTRGHATAMAKELALHPQTVRYRMKKLEDQFGDQLRDPENRIILEMALRVLWLWSDNESP